MMNNERRISTLTFHRLQMSVHHEMLCCLYLSGTVLNVMILAVSSQNQSRIPTES